MKEIRIHLIDEISKEILYMLESDKRYSIRGIAQELMRKHGSSYNIALTRVESLLQDGYITERKVYSAREISITEMGKEIIKCLRCADEIKRKYAVTHERKE